MIVEEMARIKLSANAPDGQPIDVQDIRLIDLDSGRWIPTESAELRVDVHNLITLRIDLLLHGVELSGLALANGKRRMVRMATQRDNVEGGVSLRVVDLETGTLLLTKSITFVRAKNESPHFVIEYDEEATEEFRRQHPNKNWIEDHR